MQILCQKPYHALFNQRIIESLRLEKTSKITKSNHQPVTTMPTKPTLGFQVGCEGYWQELAVQASWKRAHPHLAWLR